MSKFIPVNWLTKRYDMHVNIDCFESKDQGKVYFKPICCRKLVDGCDITTCGCDPELSIRIQVLDKNDKVITESDFKNNVTRIFIDKDSLGQIIINVE